MNSFGVSRSAQQPPATSAEAEMHLELVQLCNLVVESARIFDFRDGAVAAQTSVSNTRSAGTDVIVLSDSDDDDCSGSSPAVTRAAQAAAVAPAAPCRLDEHLPSAVARHLLDNFVHTGLLPLRTAIALISGICFMQFTTYRDMDRAEDAASGLSAAPAYLSVLSAGTVLATVLHKESFDIITGERKEAMDAGNSASATAAKDFMLSTEMLRLLLSTSDLPSVSSDQISDCSSATEHGCCYTPHRRGRWYDRLCINIERYLSVDISQDCGVASSSARASAGTSELSVGAALNHLNLQYLLNSVHNDPYVEVGVHAFFIFVFVIVHESVVMKLYCVL